MQSLVESFLLALLSNSGYKNQNVLRWRHPLIDEHDQPHCCSYTKYGVFFKSAADDSKR